MVGFDVVFDIIVKILVSFGILAGTLLFVVSAIALVVMGAPVFQCVIVAIAALLSLVVCVGMCLSAQGKL